MNAGGLLAAQPGMTLADPVLSVLWGVPAFHEGVRAGWFVVPEDQPGGRGCGRNRAGPPAQG
jgi:hypothetical protein